MPEKYAAGSTISVAKKWSTALTTAINTGTYSSEKSSWLSGMDISDPISTTMGWANDANSFVCSTVLQPGINTIQSEDLSGDYYNTAVPVFNALIARAGYRLAAWLNLIATGSTGL
jgi:hypothetical protein